LRKPFPDGLCLAGHGMVQLGQRARPQVRIQLGQVSHPGNRGAPVPLQIVHAVFHIGLLIAASRHTEPRVKAIMAGQGRIASVQLTSAPPQDRRGHGLGIIPPDLPGHAAKELEALDHAGQNRLRPFRGQSHGETKARVTPGQQQHRHLPAAVGKVHVDVSEIRLQTPARRMRQGNEGLTLSSVVLGQITPDLVVATHVAVLISQTPIELGARVPLLTRGLLILGQDLFDQRLERTQPGGRPILLQGIGTRLSLLQNLPDLTPGIPKTPGDLPNAHPVTMGDSDPAILFHRQHPFSPSIVGLLQKPHSLRSLLRWVHFRRRFLPPEVGPFYMPISTTTTFCSTI
jgi:hypothetical protein